MKRNNLKLIIFIVGGLSMSFGGAYLGIRVAESTLAAFWCGLLTASLLFMFFNVVELFWRGQ